MLRSVQLLSLVCGVWGLAVAHELTCMFQHMHRLEPVESAEQEALEQRRTTSSELGGGRSVRRHTLGRQTSFGTTL